METAGQALAISRKQRADLGRDERVALDFLTRASTPSGGFSPTYSAEHARFVRELERGDR